MKFILLCLFSFIRAVLTLIDEHDVDYAAIGPVTDVCPKVENVFDEMPEIVKFLIVKSFDVILVRIKSANIILRAKMGEVHNEPSCMSSGTNRYFYCNLRFNSIPLDAHIITQHFNPRKSIIRGALLLKQMNVILGAEIQNGVVSIRKARAVVDEFNEIKITTDLNKTTLTDWMGVVIKHLALSASCKI